MDEEAELDVEERGGHGWHCSGTGRWLEGLPATCSAPAVAAVGRRRAAGGGRREEEGGSRRRVGCEPSSGRAGGEGGVCRATVAGRSGRPLLPLSLRCRLRSRPSMLRKRKREDFWAAEKKEKAVAEKKEKVLAGKPLLVWALSQMLAGRGDGRGALSQMSKEEEEHDLLRYYVEPAEVKVEPSSEKPSSEIRIFAAAAGDAAILHGRR